MTPVSSTRIAVAFLVAAPTIGVLLILQSARALLNFFWSHMLLGGGGVPRLHELIMVHGRLLEVVILVVGATSIILLSVLHKRRWTLVVGMVTATAMTVLQYCAGSMLFMHMFSLIKQWLKD